MNPAPELRIADTSGQDVSLEPTSAARQKWVAGGIAVVLIAIGLFAWPAFERWRSAETSISGDRLRYGTVTRGDFVRDISVQGRVVAGVSPTLYATQAGTVTFVVEAGDQVNTGDLLATIDSPEITNRLEQERSTIQRLEIELQRQIIEGKQQKLENQKRVDQAGVQLTAAEREARRANQAWDKQAISQLDYEKAHDELESARLNHVHAISDAELAIERLDFEIKTTELELERQRLLVSDLARQVDELTIRSPVDGVVGNLLVTQKTTVAKNSAVLSVVDLSQFEVEVRVPEAYADDLGIGMAAEVSAGNETHEATLVSVSPEIIDNQVTGTLRFPAEPPGGLRQNQRLTTRILLEDRKDVLMVPRGQFLESGGGRIAYVIEDGVAVRRSVETGARSLNAVEILSGLEAGDRIVISSTELFEGAQRVLITN